MLKKLYDRFFESNQNFTTEHAKNCKIDKTFLFDQFFYLKYIFQVALQYLFNACILLNTVSYLKLNF